MQPLVHIARGDQLWMRADRDHPPGVHHHDAVGDLQRVQPVRNQERRPPFGGSRERAASAGGWPTSGGLPGCRRHPRSGAAWCAPFTNSFRAAWISASLPASIWLVNSSRIRIARVAEDRPGQGDLCLCAAGEAVRPCRPIARVVPVGQLLDERRARRPSSPPRSPRPRGRPLLAVGDVARAPCRRRVACPA